jgi:pimeloyl-ACP methyl ester carboxylesterase
MGPAGELAGWHKRPVLADAAAAPILFLHPINTQGAIWEDVAEALSPQRECIMPDLRAHGRSAASGNVGLDAWLEDCLWVLDEIASVDALHVVGGSLGGLLACAMAAVRPEQVLSVTALGSSLDFKGADVEEQIGAFDRFGVRGTFERSFRETAFGRYADNAVINRGIALSNPNDVETVKRVWAAVLASDGRDHARLVRCKALAVTGELDVTCSPTAGLDLARVLGTVQVLLPDIGHMPMLECPQLVATLLDLHLKEVEA